MNKASIINETLSVLFFSHIIINQIYLKIVNQTKIHKSKLITSNKSMYFKKYYKNGFYLTNIYSIFEIKTCFFF